MAGVCKALKCCSLVRASLKASPTFTRGIHATSAVFGGAWNRDWLPGSHPNTPEEKAAAAKKYGLRPEDYIPYDPHNDPGYGDYPNTKWVGQAARDPYEHFDYQHLGYNYGESINRYAAFSMGDRYNPQWHERAYYSPSQMVLGFLTVWGGLFLLQCLCSYFDLNIHMPVMPKQYPDNLWLQRGKDPASKPDITHYTFEPAE